jgi:hypothetical protein
VAVPEELSVWLPLEEVLELPVPVREDVAVAVTLREVIELEAVAVPEELSVWLPLEEALELPVPVREDVIELEAVAVLEELSVACNRLAAPAPPRPCVVAVKKDDDDFERGATEAEAVAVEEEEEVERRVAPKGALKSAAVPTPSLEPDVVPDELPPASVMTVCAIARINARNMKMARSFEDIMRDSCTGEGGGCIGCA